MVYLVLGGGASGKSEYAEAKALELAKENKHFYVATMMAYGEAGAYRVKRHRALREGKGFTTLEIPTNIKSAVELAGGQELASHSTALIEDLSNLLANEMYGQDEPDLSEELPMKIADQLKAICQAFEHVVIVSNNIFDDGCEYQMDTKTYIKNLGIIHCALGAFVDQVTEVVVGIPQELK